MDDTNNINTEIKPTEKPAVDKRRHFLAVFFFSFMWGTFGADRFYLGKIWTGIFKLLTLGGFGIWTIVDLALVMSGGMRDKQGNEMLETDRYKRFAHNTALIFAAVILILFVLAGVWLVVAFTQFMQNGGFDQFISDGQIDVFNMQDTVDQFNNLEL